MIFDNDIFPIVEEEFLTKDAINFLMDWIESNDSTFDEHQSNISYWNKKCIYYKEIISEDVQYILKQACLAMKKYIEINTPNESKKLYVETPQLVRWRHGDVMTPHADNVEQDGVTPNTSPWREFGGVIYLNSDFDGGKIYYPNLNIEVTPRTGMMVIHPANLKYTHGVSEVTKGKRYTISTFFTFDQLYGGFLSESYNDSI